MGEVDEVMMMSMPTWVFNAVQCHGLSALDHLGRQKNQKGGAGWWGEKCKLGQGPPTGALGTGKMTGTRKGKDIPFGEYYGETCGIIPFVGGQQSCPAAPSSGGPQQPNFFFCRGLKLFLSRVIDRPKSLISYPLCPDCYNINASFGLRFQKFYRNLQGGTPTLAFLSRDFALASNPVQLHRLTITILVDYVVFNGIFAFTHHVLAFIFFSFSVPRSTLKRVFPASLGLNIFIGLTYFFYTPPCTGCV